MRAQSARRDRSAFLLASAYAATLWSFVFAGVSFYWVLGGGFLYGAQSPQILKLAAQPWFLVVVWFTGLLKLIAGLLALVQRWGERVPG